MSTWRFILEAIAITLVFTKGTIFARLRESGPKIWRELAHCPLCAGVWIGMLWHLLRAWPVHLSLPTAADTLSSGAITGVSALTLTLFLALLDRWS